MKTQVEIIWEDAKLNATPAEFMKIVALLEELFYKEWHRLINK